MTRPDPAERSVEEFFDEIAAAHRRCFWLDGGGAREWSGRRSLVGWLEPDAVSLTYRAATGEVVRHRAGRAEVVAAGDRDVFAVLAEEIAAGDERDQWFGYFGYAARPDLPAAVDAAGPPDAVWMRASEVRVFEHPPSGGRAGPLFGGRSGPVLGGRAGRAPGEAVSRPDRPHWYADAFDRVQEELHAGNSYEVNLTYRVDALSDLTPAAAYHRLRASNPAPYAGFLQHDVPGAEAWLLSSSPERFATIGAPDADGRRRLHTKPIKGTAARSADPEEDRRARVRLAASPKERAENLMIVDLLRNDLAQVCEVGSVRVPTLMEVESYAAVHQLVSAVEGTLPPEVGSIDALRALFPAGSMTGAPKLRTMRIIEDVESTPRGIYAGAFGWVSGDGRADLGVVIRSLSTIGDGRWRLGTGGGITVESEPAAEYAESLLKAERVRTALDPTGPDPAASDPTGESGPAAG